jgi:hypothetical protein
MSSRPSRSTRNTPAVENNHISPSSTAADQLAVEGSSAAAQTPSSATSRTTMPLTTDPTAPTTTPIATATTGIDALSSSGSASTTDPLVLAILNNLDPEQVRLLLARALVPDSENLRNPAPISEGNSTTTPPTNPAIQALHERYPAIDPTNFREILENKFRPENVIKLSTSFTPAPRRQETLTLGVYTIPTTERDRESNDYRGGIPSLMQPFEIYSQILLHFAPPGIRWDLQGALADYRDLIYTLNRIHTFDTLKLFHFTFHRKRLSLGVYDPAGWREKDTALQMAILIRRSNTGDDPSTTVTRNKRPFEGPQGSSTRDPRPSRAGLTSGWEKSSSPPTVCFDFNRGQCTRGTDCSYKHVCRSCFGAHPALDHDRVTGAEPDANSAPLGTRAPKRH